MDENGPFIGVMTNILSSPWKMMALIEIDFIGLNEIYVD